MSEGNKTRMNDVLLDKGSRLVQKGSHKANISRQESIDKMSYEELQKYPPLERNKMQREWIEGDVTNRAAAKEYQKKLNYRYWKQLNPEKAAKQEASKHKSVEKARSISDEAQSMIKKPSTGMTLAERMSQTFKGHAGNILGMVGINLLGEQLDAYTGTAQSRENSQDDIPDSQVSGPVIRKPRQTINMLTDPVTNVYEGVSKMLIPINAAINQPSKWETGQRSTSDFINSVQKGIKNQRMPQDNTATYNNYNRKK